MKSQYPKCTHCQYEFDEEEMWHDMNDVGKVYIGECDQSDLKCPSCLKEFHVTCQHHYTFLNVDSEGEDIL